MILRTLLAIGVAVAASAAHGHYAYNWIMENPETQWCCGPQDCFRVEATDTGRGWTFQKFGKRYSVSYRGRNVFPSKRPGFHACFTIHSHEKPLRCFFYQPGMG